MDMGAVVILIEAAAVGGGFFWAMASAKHGLVARLVLAAVGAFGLVYFQHLLANSLWKKSFYLRGIVNGDDFVPRQLYAVLPAVLILAGIAWGLGRALSVGKVSQRWSGGGAKQVALGSVIVTGAYVMGSAVSYGLDLGNITDLRLPLHVGTLVAFAWIAMRLSGRRIARILAVLAVSYVCAGLYEEMWRRAIWSAGYEWGYHLWTLQWWVASCVLGTALGWAIERLARSGEGVRWDIPKG